VSERERHAPGLQDLLSIGAVCGVMIGVGVFAGYLLDKAAGTSPLLTFLGLAFGILGAATGSYFVIRPYLKD
jgi:F0F1-type ATP synthase assembly protein I